MRAFFDSDVVVYALAGVDDRRRETALALLETHAADRQIGALVICKWSTRL